MRITPIHFKKLCTTRFRSYRIALKPALSNWHAIVVYYKREIERAYRKTVKVEIVFGS